MVATLRFRKFLFPACVQPQTNWGNQIDRKFTCYFIGYFTDAQLYNSSICRIQLRRIRSIKYVPCSSWTTTVFLEVHAAVLLQFVLLSRTVVQAEPASLWKSPIFQVFLSYHMCSAYSFAVYGGTCSWTPFCVFLIVKCFHVCNTRVSKVSEWIYDELVPHLAHVS